MKSILRLILATLLLAWAVARGEAADVIGQHWGTATEKAQYRAWASYDGWSTDMQADNYPFKPAEASQVNHNRTLQDLLIRAPAGSAHDIAIRVHFSKPGPSVSVHAFVVMGTQEEIKHALDAIVAYAKATSNPYVFRK